jgi:hypothetical protein
VRLFLKKKTKKKCVFVGKNRSRKKNETTPCREKDYSSRRPGRRRFVLGVDSVHEESSNWCSLFSLAPGTIVFAVVVFS